MRLKQIKLAGFKSFVDVTKIPFLNALSAIIGPNGCGKSNVIDAVRWVLGESSAKHLRGDSMLDVIFNGSSARRPVSVASVELLFENNHGRLGGEYASYNEISVKRQVSRDGDSAYFLNGQKCRRKDITELFMGTGLGARSYAIIGQGTISRLIESKPQELRVFIEEAAGISRYKERRRDTENRIRHTRENLERLGDIRTELTVQLEKLAAQAKAAKKYRELKQEERRCHSELLVVRYQALMAQLDDLSKQITEQELLLAKAQSAHDKEVVELTQVQTELDALSDIEHSERSIYYEANTKIASLEQQLQAENLRQTQTKTALTELANKVDAINRQLVDNQNESGKLTQQSQAINIQISALETGIEQKHKAVEAARQKDIVARKKRESQAKVTTESRHELSLSKKQLEHIVSTQKRLSEQYHIDETALNEIQVSEPIKGEQADAVTSKEPCDEAHLSLEALSGQLQELEQEGELQAERESAVEEELEQNQASLGEAETQLQASLQQRAGLIARIEVLEQLLANANQDGDKLWQHLHIDKGWELASALALGGAIHFPVISSHLYSANDNQGKARPQTVTHEALGFVSQSKQIESESNLKASNTRPTPISSALNIFPWLNGIHWVQDIVSAEALLPKIALDERIVTADGYLLGHGFRLTQLAEEPSLLVFNEERQELTVALSRLDSKIEHQESHKRELEERCNQISGTLLVSRQEIALNNASQARINQVITNRQHQEALKQQKVADLSQRIAKVKQELSEMSATHFEVSEQLISKQALLENTMALESSLEEEARQSAKVYTSENDEFNNAKQALERLKSEQAPLITQIALNQQAYHQLDAGLQDYQKQKLQLDLESSQNGDNDDSKGPSTNKRLQQELDEQLELRQTKQNRLQEIHEQQVRLQEQVDTLGVNKKQHLAKTEALNQNSSNLKLRREGVKGQADSQRLILQEEGIEISLLNDKALSVKNEQQRQAELDRIRRGIARLGAINLAAIEEYEQQSERKQYLDEQNDDLNKALTSLEDAIRKIDRETRSRFKQTFEQVNHDLGLLFPKVFGGGSAYLAMTDDDLLDTGVTIMARPPGKKNSTIHLLSGGEKALTALSLVFAIFRLNPAPFCMLDEVDAPLDDANVERFCRLLQEMSQSVQFIYISHNKITMEMADQLIGVTMHEPGVSRIVAVDIDEAVALADAG